MSQERDILIEKAEQAITNVFSDKSVSKKETAQNLRELQGHIQTMLDTLE